MEPECSLQGPTTGPYSKLNESHSLTLTHTHTPLKDPF